MDGIEVFVNGQARDCSTAGPHTSLLDWLRGEGLTGAKEGCAEGECGACAVLVARPDGPRGSRWTSLNSCLPPALAFDGQEIITAEGLGTVAGPCSVENLHPVQREMADRGGSQCGYCTPGFICSMAAEYYRPDRSPGQAHKATGTGAVGEQHATDHECGPNGFDLHALSGNLCRCTGYRPIRDAAYALGTPQNADPLMERQNRPAPPTKYTGSGSSAQFRRPKTLAEALRVTQENPEAKLVAGATDLGVEVNLRHSRPPLLLAIDRLEELRTLAFDDGRVEIGAALTLSEVERGLDGRVPLLAQLFPQFASRLIRNAATLGGNLSTGSPIGDSAPALLALDATVVLCSLDGEREVPLSGYYTGYRQSVKKPHELLRAVRIPLPLAESTAFYKISKRRFDDISSVSVAIALQVADGVVDSVRIGLGGVAATPIRAFATEESLTGQPWNAATAATAAATMAGEGTPIDDMRASALYRQAMLGQALLKFHAGNAPALEAAK
ncbi:FAD binding domain-containing protein [Arthrobacter sp. OY3WO11]|uniref:xanthine dehydrogenase small subunit n=1 Tax=Arthrobacter sp. OY3WO11 TaxID=1835723 RepID=UPI0007D01F9C|nr:FAD binding domain-containing protein [Arthrobacter sp. OY3WO11]OAE02971.1 xanthine dehydrogenase small subunit [Arthrobacter sp. OY3WO11]